MKLFIVDFKMDFELSSVSQNSPFSHLGAKFSFELLLVRVTDLPLTRWSKLLHLPCSLCLTLHLVLLQLPIFSCWELQAAFVAAQKPSPHCSDTRSCQYSRLVSTSSCDAKFTSKLHNLSNTKQVITKLLSCKRKEWPVSSSADFHQTLHSKNSILHWNPNLLLQRPAPFLQRLVMLN